MADGDAVDATAEYEGSWETEGYVPGDDGTTIAQVIYDTGVMALVNANVLHMHGLAMGVTTDDDGKVTGINLHRTDDPKGIWFDEKTTQHARAKLEANGLLLSPAARGVPGA